MNAGLDWARRLVARFESGERGMNVTAVRMAHEALGLPVPKGYGA